ncbi:MAG TPA: hypothetical protein VF161_08675 [Steroidobacteraceae bacterium]
MVFVVTTFKVGIASARINSANDGNGNSNERSGRTEPIGPTQMRASMLKRIIALAVRLAPWLAILRAALAA